MNCALFKFIGKDSLGYKSGRYYKLMVEIVAESIYIHSFGVANACEYSSIIAFMKNWQFISK